MGMFDYVHCEQVLSILDAEHYSHLYYRDHKFQTKDIHEDGGNLSHYLIDDQGYLIEGMPVWDNDLLPEEIIDYDFERGVVKEFTGELVFYGELLPGGGDSDRSWGVWRALFTKGRLLTLTPTQKEEWVIPENWPPPTKEEQLEKENKELKERCEQLVAQVNEQDDETELYIRALNLIAEYLDSGDNMRVLAREVLEGKAEFLEMAERERRRREMGLEQ